MNIINTVQNSTEPSLVINHHFLRANEIMIVKLSLYWLIWDPCKI